MKRLILQRVVLFFVSLLLLTSCMGEGRNVQSGWTFGIVRSESGKKLLDVNVSDIPFYSYRFKEASDGNCFFITFEIDFDKPENSYENIEKNGYFDISIDVKEDVPSWPVYSTLTSTTNVLPNEVPIVEAIWNGEYLYLNGKFIMHSVMLMPTDQRMTWDLSYDMDNMLTDDGQRHYNVFLRSAIRGIEGTNSKETFSIVNAFDMKYYLETVAEKEKELGSSEFIIRFNYPSAIDEDGQITWDYKDTRDIMVELIIPKE